MTHWARPRGLKADLRLLTAARLHAIALELEADHAAAVMANLEAAADPTPWPSSTGGAGSSTSPTSPVLAAVERLLSQPKPKPGQEPTTATARAGRLLVALGELARLAAIVDPGLHEWSPARTIARCSTCGDPLRPDKRCTACGSRDGAVRACADCMEPEDRHGLRPWPPKGWTGYVDGPGRVVCVGDWMWRHRHEGRPKVRLALGDNVIEQAEAAGA